MGSNQKLLTPTRDSVAGGAGILEAASIQRRMGSAFLAACVVGCWFFVLRLPWPARGLDRVGATPQQGKLRFITAAARRGVMRLGTLGGSSFASGETAGTAPLGSGPSACAWGGRLGEPLGLAGLECLVWQVPGFDARRPSGMPARNLQVVSAAFGLRGHHEAIEKAYGGLGIRYTDL